MKPMKIPAALALGAMLAACGGGSSGGGTPAAADTAPDPFAFSPALVDNARPGQHVIAEARVTGFDGKLTARVSGRACSSNVPQCPSTSLFVGGSEGSESVQLAADETLTVRMTVGSNARIGDTFETTITLGDGENAQSATLKAIVSDHETPALTVDFPARRSISTSHKTSITGRVSDNTGVESVRIAELPGETVQMDEDGSWIFPDIPLASGNNTLKVEATDVDGNVTTEVLDIYRDPFWFEDPVAVHAISDTRVLVLDNGTDTLYEINPETADQRIVSGPDTEGAEDVPMRHAKDMTVDAENEMAYVVNAGPQINGIIEISIATGARRIVSSTFADDKPELAYRRLAGANANGTLSWTAPSRVSFFLGPGNLRLLFVASEGHFYKVLPATGEREHLWSADAVIDDIEAGTFVSGTTDAGVVVLSGGELSFRDFNNGEIRGSQRSSATWLARKDSGSVVMLEEDSNVYRLNGYEPVNNELLPDQLLPDNDPVLLRNAVAAAYLPESNRYLLVGRKLGAELFSARALVGNNNDGVSALIPADLPALFDKTSLGDLLDGFGYVTFDPARKKMYVTQGFEVNFRLLELDPATGDRRLLLHGLDNDPFQLGSLPHFAAHDGTVYMVNDTDAAAAQDRGIYSVSVEQCSGEAGEQDCVRPFFVNADFDEEGGLIIDEDPILLQVVGDELVLMARDVYIDDTRTNDQAIVRFDLDSGALLSRTLFENIGTRAALQDGLIFGKPNSDNAIASYDYRAESPGLTETVVSQCAYDDLLFATECTAVEGVSGNIGTGPGLNRVRYLSPAGRGQLFARLTAKTNSPYDPAIEANPTGFYLIDTASGNRVFLFGQNPFDGNTVVSEKGLDGVPDTEGRQFIYYDGTLRHVASITYRSAVNPETGETYYPVSRVIIAH